MSYERFKEVAEFLRKARVEAGLSQAYVANELGYTSPQFVSNWERGLAGPPTAILKRLAKLYKVNAEELFGLILKDVERQMRYEFKTGTND